MKIALCIFCIFLLVLLCSSAKKRKPHKKRRSGSLMGKFTSIKDYQFMVGLMRMYARYPKQFCSGAVIAPTFVLTAGHCLFPKYIQQAIAIGKVVVRGGTTNIRGSTGYDHKIYGYKIHEKYNNTGYQNDIALIQVKDPLDNIFENSIAYVEKDYDYPQIDVIGLGWKRTELNGVITERLRIDILAIVKSCYNYWIQDLPGRVCVVRHRPCAGDNGAPVILPNSSTIIGIVSWYRTCHVGSPVSLTRVGYYNDWIAKSMLNVSSVD